MVILSNLRGVTFNGKHNKDFNIAMERKSIQSPSKKKIKDSVPFMNGSYDFSTIGSNGEITYNEREIAVTFGLPANNKEQLQVLYSKILEWLVDTGKQQLIFDDIKDYYFMAEVEDVTSFEQTMEFGKLEVKFVANPFKYSIYYIGNDIWDTFNFEEDRVQDVSFDIVSNATISLYNPGRSTKPVINCSSNMTITKGGITYNLNTGDNKPYGFFLNSGENSLIINGNGTINFTFRKESL